MKEGMFRVEKFYPKGFDPIKHWEERYLQSYSLGKNADEFRSQPFWPLLQKNLEKGKHYVDAGCAGGGWVLFLTDEGYQVEGIDESRRVLQAMTEYNPDVTVTVASMTAMPYGAASLDGVLAIGTLEYKENEIEKALREAYRVLKPGGLLFLEVPIINTLRRLFYIPLKQQDSARRKKKGERSQFAYYLFDVEQLKKLMKTIGFEVTTTKPHEIPGKENHYGLYVDWPFLRGKQPYQLNTLGRLVKTVCNAVSPWIASTGAVMIARKK